MYTIMPLLIDHRRICSHIKHGFQQRFIIGDHSQMQRRIALVVLFIQNALFRGDYHFADIRSSVFDAVVQGVFAGEVGDTGGGLLGNREI